MLDNIKSKIPIKFRLFCSLELFDIRLSKFSSDKDIDNYLRLKSSVSKKQVELTLEYLTAFLAMPKCAKCVA